MNEYIILMTYAVVIGCGATIIMDLWAIMLKRFFGISSLNYAMVGRWIGHLPKGYLVHQNIAQSLPIKHEKALGWLAHYLIGIAFAALLLVIYGLNWATPPRLLPALIIGIVTVLAPFFILQPGMGAGIAASKTPKPNVARFRSLLAHTAFGFGLYISAGLVAILFPLS